MQERLAAKLRLAGGLEMAGPDGTVEPNRIGPDLRVVVERLPPAVVAAERAPDARRWRVPSGTQHEA
jgi:hypothetical protein